MGALLGGGTQSALHGKWSYGEAGLQPADLSPIVNPGRRFALAWATVGPGPMARLHRPANILPDSGPIQLATN